MQNKKKFEWREWLISLIITLIMLGLVVGAQYWFTQTTKIELDTKFLWIGNVIGSVLMLFIVHHFVKKPKDDN